MSCVILIEVQSTGINSRPEEKKRRCLYQSIFGLHWPYCILHVGMIHLCPVGICHVHTPCRFNLAPEAEGFIYIEFALSCQRSENVLLQPDGLCSVPAVGWLLSARDIISLSYQVTVQNQGSSFNEIKYCAKS